MKTSKTNKIGKTNPDRLEYVIKAKASYRADARAKTWEEKVASIARMRRAAAEQKRRVA
ncbi:MAG: hypothetical protein HY935_08750 [Nitrosomonadales bacterium]|nr:hypothetical protein [Nitrosomonadales bacterium]